MQDLWQKIINDVLVPTLIAVATAAITAVAAKVIAWLNAWKAQAAVAEAVAAVEQTMKDATGDEKKTLVKEMLEADPRVKVVSDAAIEAAVLSLPRKACQTDQGKEE